MPSTAITTLDHVMLQEAFEQTVLIILENAPQLLWEEGTVAGCYRPSQSAANRLADCRFETFATQGAADTAMDKMLSTPFSDTGKAAFRATCRTIEPDDGAGFSRLIFHTTHGTMEGGDVANILRGRLTTRSQRPVDDAGPSLGIRIGSSVVVPLMWCLHLGMAWTEKHDVRTFAYHRFFIARSRIKEICNDWA
ncbi:hypothetical protein [Pseudooctadecabacter jejudonensis]|nr:hypothetical protein [Pseudooctadecabacter jejudonensis]